MLLLELRMAAADLRLTLALLRVGRAFDGIVPKYRPDQPRAPKGTPLGGQWIDDRMQLAQTSPRCDGFSGGCQVGGSYGNSGWIKIHGKNLCLDCAIKLLGLEGLSPEEQLEILRNFDKGIK